MHSTQATLYLHFFLLPLFAQAQEPIGPQWNDHSFYGPVYFVNAQDSADFIQFRKRLQRADATLSIDTTIQYRMLWCENLHGGMRTVSRGDSSLTKSPKDPWSTIDPQVGYAYYSADERRVILLMRETPCALLCLSTWYYVEE